MKDEGFFYVTLTMHNGIETLILEACCEKKLYNCRPSPSMRQLHTWHSPCDGLADLKWLTENNTSETNAIRYSPGAADV